MRGCTLFKSEAFSSSHWRPCLVHQPSSQHRYWPVLTQETMKCSISQQRHTGCDAGRPVNRCSGFPRTSSDMAPLQATQPANCVSAGHRLSMHGHGRWACSWINMQYRPNSGNPITPPLSPADHSVHNPMTSFHKDDGSALLTFVCPFISHPEQHMWLLF